MIAIIDYGVGNLFSLYSSFKAIGEDAVVTGDEKVIRSAERIILPGVGAFEDAVKKLKHNGLDIIIKEEVNKGKNLLGICLGMQMLTNESYEFGKHEGLGLITGKVVPLSDYIDKSFKIPHIGWNKLVFNTEIPKSKLYKYVGSEDHVYFVHSFFAKTENKFVSATTDYGISVTASIENNNVYGTQFHPEKSGKIGLSILKAFCEIK